MEYLIFVILCILFIFTIILRKRILGYYPGIKSLLDVISGILAFLIALPLAFTLIVSLKFYEYHPNRKFDRESWEENANNRFEMRKDMLRSEIFLHKSKNQLVALIGLPSEKIDLTADTLSHWSYYLGTRAWGMGVDLKIYYLEIEFEEGISSKVEVLVNIE